MQVKVVQHGGKVVLVEWIDNGMPKRGILPAAVMENDYVTQGELDRAIPVGEPWEEIELSATPESLARNLRNAGIWTVDDLRRRPDVVNGVLLKTYSVDYQTLLKRFTR